MSAAPHDSPPGASLPPDRLIYPVAHTAATLVFIVAVWTARFPHGLSTAMVPTLLLLIVSTIFYPFVAVRALLDAHRFPGVRRRWAVRVLSHCVYAPALVAMLSILIHFDIPFRLAFAWSKSALVRTVTSLEKDEAPRTPDYAGILPLRSARRALTSEAPSGVVLEFNIKPFPWGNVGLLYTQQPPVSNGRYVVTHIEGPWYTWEYGGW